MSPLQMLCSSVAGLVLKLILQVPGRFPESQIQGLQRTPQRETTLPYPTLHYLSVLVRKDQVAVDVWFAAEGYKVCFF